MPFFQWPGGLSYIYSMISRWISEPGGLSNIYSMISRRISGPGGLSNIYSMISRRISGSGGLSNIYSMIVFQRRTVPQFWSWIEKTNVSCVFNLVIMLYWLAKKIKLELKASMCVLISIAYLTLTSDTLSMLVKIVLSFWYTTICFFILSVVLLRKFNSYVVIVTVIIIVI